MSKIYKSVEEERSQSLLVIGTENQEIIVIDKSCMAINKSFQLKSVPVFIVAQGCYDIEYKIFVACRNGSIFLIKNGNISNSFKLHIESKPTGLIKLDKTIIISGMNQNIYSFYNKGSLNFSK